MDAQIKDFMTEQPHSIRFDETLKHAKDMMEKYNIRHLPVAEGGRIVGLISERDFSLIHSYPDMDLNTSKVDELMLQSIYEVRPDAYLKDVVGEMAEKKFGSALVVDESEKLMGIFTSIDGLRLLHKLYDA